MLSPLLAARRPAYVVALFVSALAALAPAIVGPLVDARLTFALFYAAVAVASWFGGFQPGILVTLVGGLTNAYFFLPPTHSLRLERSSDAAALILFVMTGVGISVLAEMAHQTLRRDRAARVEAERLARQ